MTDNSIVQYVLKNSQRDPRSDTDAKGKSTSSAEARGHLSERDRLKRVTDYFEIIKGPTLMRGKDGVPHSWIHKANKDQRRARHTGADSQPTAATSGL